MANKMNTNQCRNGYENAYACKMKGGEVGRRTHRDGGKGAGGKGGEENKVRGGLLAASRSRSLKG